jgi:amidase
MRRRHSTSSPVTCPETPIWAEPEGSYLRDRPEVGRLRIGLQATAESGVHSEIQDLVRRVAGCLEQLGHDVEEAGPDTAPFRGPFGMLSAAGTASYPVSDVSLLDPLNVHLMEASRRLTAADYVQAVNTIRNHSRVVVSFWDDHDLLLTPTLTPIGSLADPEQATRVTMDWITFTMPYNCTGQPAITLPLGTLSDGLPVGVQLVGAPRGEMRLLAAAAQLEAVMPWHDRRPPDVA